MHRARHAFPASDLLGAVDAGRADITLALGRDLGRFRDDEPGARALGIIEGVELGRHVAGAGAAPSERRHDDAVREPERSDVYGGEESWRGLGAVLHGEPILRERSGAV